MEIGVITLGELLSDPSIGKKISPRQGLEEILAAAKLADEAGLDVFGVGEHHRLDFVVSAVPVREFENFATLDLLSGGRAEMIAGRGAFPLRV